MMGDLTLQQVLLRIGALLLLGSVHGGTLAAIAVALGDAGPRQDDRLTVSPWRQLDPIGGLLVAFFSLGWIRPLAIDPARTGRVGLIVVVAGSSAMTLALAILARLARPFILNILPDTAAATCYVFVETLGDISVDFTVFNLLPVPVLTGQHLLTAALPRHIATITRLQPYAAVVLGLLIVTGVAERLLAPAEAAVAGVILNRPGYSVR